MNLILYFLSALGWSIPFFLFKDLTNYLTNIDIILVNHIIWHFFILSFMVFILIFKNNKATQFINKIKKLPTHYLYRIIFIVLLGIISQLSYLRLIKFEDVSIVIPNIRALSTIFIGVLGYFIFKETITLIKSGGLILILLGIYLLN